jgi:hypothetical protein
MFTNVMQKAILKDADRDKHMYINTLMNAKANSYASDGSKMIKKYSYF